MAETSGHHGLSTKAVISLLLGLLSFGLLILTGLPALVVGLSGLRDINRSDGRLRGRWLAVAGMATGALGTLVFLAGTLILVLSSVHLRSKRVTCEHNLFRIGNAAQAYHNANEPHTFPPGTIPNEQLPPPRRLSWLAALLPYPSLGHADLFGRIDRDRDWDDDANRPVVQTTVRWFLCPGHPDRASGRAPALTHYVGLAGVGADAAELPADDPRAGVFGYNRGTSPDQMQAGTSHTLMAVETAEDNGPWAAGGPATVRGVDPQRRPHFGPGRPFGGLHANGANVLYADGSVTFLTDSMKPELFELQTQINRGD